jgi:hypothetical protein
MIALMMQAVRTAETSANLHRCTRRYNPADGHLHSQRRENLKSYLTKNILGTCSTFQVFNHLLPTSFDLFLVLQDETKGELKQERSAEEKGRS